MSLKNIKGASFGQIVCRMLSAEKNGNAVWGSGFLSRIFRPSKLLPVIRKLVSGQWMQWIAQNWLAVGGESMNSRLRGSNTARDCTRIVDKPIQTAQVLVTFDTFEMPTWSYCPTETSLLLHFFLLPIDKFSTQGWVSGEGLAQDLTFKTTVAEGKVRLGFLAS